MLTACRWVGCCVAMAVLILAAPVPGQGSMFLSQPNPPGTPLLVLCNVPYACASVDVTADESATGLEAQSPVVNPPGTAIEPRARAMASANLDTDVGEARATATLTANATGIGAVSAGPGTLPDRIRNDGAVTATALAGEDSNGVSQPIASAKTVVSLGSAEANATGTSTVNAAGIRTGSNGADITNAGSLTVLGRAHAQVSAEAEAQNGTATATSRSTTTATAIGIDAAWGDNRVRNEGPLSVSAVVQDAVARSEARSGSSDATARADVAATATATGISTGAGRDDIRNTGRLTVIADTDAVAEALALTPAAARFETANASGIARATGIDAGAGSNVIRNDGTLNVRAIATARASTFGGIGGFSIAFGATATGIRVGDGGSEIHNTGTINVLASGRALGVSSAVAVGILGGNGDDTVVNEGTIFAVILDDPVVFRTSVPTDAVLFLGTAISTGAGNDTVTLGARSQTMGNIELGDGDDRLTVVGSAAVAGVIQAGAGTDTLVLDGAGNLGTAPLGFEQAVKQGVGTYALPSLAPLQRLTVREGTLRLSSSYQFNPTGTFQATVYADGRHGQLAVVGTAALGGTLQILRGSGTFRSGTTYSVVVANAVTDWFSSIILPAASPLVSFRVNGLSDRVEVETVVQRFTTVATNPVEHRLARHLDQLLGEASGDLATVLAEIQGLPAGGFARAFASLSPAAHDSFTLATHGSSRQVTQSLQRRLDTVRAVTRTAGEPAPAGAGLLAAAGGPSLVPVLGTYQVAQAQPKHGLWANGFGQWDTHEATPGFAGFSASTGGLTVGYDYTVGDQLTAGLSLGYAHTDVDLADDQGGGRIQGLFPSLYASYFTQTTYVEGALAYGHNWYKNQRNLVIGGIQRTARSDHEGNAVAAYLGAGYAYPLGAWAVGPVGALQYVYLAESGFQETGADSLNLRVASRNTNSLVSELGARVSGTLKTAAGTLVPDLSLLWRYDFALDDRTLTTTYAGAPGAAFAIAGQPTARHGLVVRPGLTFVHPAGVSTTLRYTGQFQNHFQSHALLGEVRVQF